jgi:hypothetical protein
MYSAFALIATAVVKVAVSILAASEGSTWGI